MSKIHKSQSSAIKGQKVPHESEVSIFHLIIWLFLSPEKLPEDQIKRIQGYYFTGINAIVGFNPTVQNQKQLQDSIDKIMTQNKYCLIKVVVSDKLINKVSGGWIKNPRVIQIYQHIQAPSLIYDKKSSENKSKPLKEQERKSQPDSRLFQKLVQKSADLGYFLEKAEKQVQKFTKSFRTFYNSLPLINNFAQDANRNRLHLLSSIYMKVSQLKPSLKEFQKFVDKQFPHMSNHIEKIEKNGLKPTQSQSLKEYYQLTRQFIEEQIRYANLVLSTKKQEHRKEKFDQDRLQQLLKDLENDFDKKRSKFYLKILDIYQSQRLFYHVLNTTLKTATQNSKSYIKQQVLQKTRNSGHVNANKQQQIKPEKYQQKRQGIQNIKYVSLPFSQTYQAINFNYRKQIQKQMAQGFDASKKFYTKPQPFTVYRAGRINKSQFKYYKDYKGQMFIEFFGFISTSENLKVALDFAQKCKKHNKDSQQFNSDENQDMVILFKIECHFNQKILNHCFANHGFYRYQKNFEKEVLFNSLNIFKLVGIRSQKIINLLSEKQKEQYYKKQNTYKESANENHYKDDQKKYHQSSITIIQLNYGRFHDVLLEQNPCNLEIWQIAAKENYVYYMNKALKYKFQQFDFADACQLLNQLEKAYKYLKAKVIQNFQAFEISQIDGKNYCLRLSQICLKLGYSQQGLYYAKLSEKCHEVMSKYQMRQIYNNHYQKFFQMQTTIVNILQENSDFLSAERELKRQINCITSKKFTHPMAKLRESEMNINLGVNQFEMGKLKQCLQTFKKCSKTIDFALKQIVATDVDQPSCSDYFSACCLENWVCWPWRFFKAEKQRRLQQKRQQVQKQYGRQQQLYETESMVKDVSSKAKETFIYQAKFFKKQSQYEKLLNTFSASIQKEAIFKKSKQSEQQKLQNQIKSIIIKISTVQINSKEYEDYFQQLKRKVDIINRHQKEKIVYSKDKPDISEFVQKFKERQRKRRIEHLKDKKKQIMTKNYEKFKKEYVKEIQQIKQVVNNLRHQGYIQNTTHVLKQQNNIAKIRFQSEDYKQALKDVSQIIKYDDQQYQRKYFQLASAYLTQAKIYYQLKHVQDCLQAVEKALQNLQKTFLQNRTLKQMDIRTEKLSHLSQALKEGQASDQQKAVQILKQHNLFLQTKIIKAKALLVRYEQQKQQANKFKNVQTKFHQIAQETESQIHLLLIDVNDALNKKDKIEDINELRVQVLQAQALFVLSKKIDIEQGFKLIKQCLDTRNKKLGHPNAANILFCSQIVIKYYEDSQIRSQIAQCQLTKQISESHYHFKNLSFYKTIQQAIRKFDKNAYIDFSKNDEPSNNQVSGNQTTSVIQKEKQGQRQFKEQIYSIESNENSQLSQERRAEQTQAAKKIEQFNEMGMKSKNSFSTQNQSNISFNNSCMPISSSLLKKPDFSNDLSGNKKKQSRRQVQRAKRQAIPKTTIKQEIQEGMITNHIQVQNPKEKDTRKQKSQKRLAATPKMKKQQTFNQQISFDQFQEQNPRHR